MLFVRSNRNWLLKGCMGFLILLLSLTSYMPIFLLPAHAASLQGSIIGDSTYSISLEEGSTREFAITFKNTGDESWVTQGMEPVSLITVDPIRRRSFAQDASWNFYYRPLFLPVERVASGASVQFRFIMKAPGMVGRSSEAFQLVAGDRLIPGTKFTIDFSVTQKIVQKKETVQVASDGTPVVAIEQGYPVRDASYTAQEVIRSFSTATAAPGATLSFRIGFKNIGSSTWERDGTSFVSAYTVQPNYHASVFADDSWFSDHQVKMETSRVAPGEVGYFSFTLRAPQRPGDFVEYFRLAVEDNTWIAQSSFPVRVIVSNPITTTEESTNTGSSSVTADPVSTDASFGTAPFLAFKMIQSAEKLLLKPGEITTYSVGFKNTGTQTWRNQGDTFVSLYTWGPKYRLSAFYASTAPQAPNWVNPTQIKMESDVVAPGEVGYFRFVFQAPTTPGTYTERFMLAAEDTAWISGGYLEIPIEVTNDSASDSSVIPDPAPTMPVVSGSEPLMRVGLFNTKEEVRVTASGPFEVKNASGGLEASVRAGGVAVVRYDFGRKKYLLTIDSLQKEYDAYLRFVPVNNSVIMEVQNYNRRASWNQDINFNQWRGTLEIRYSEQTGRLWMIDELPMSDYLKGIAETSSRSPLEFLKVMTIVARTYATYHYQRQTKHADEHFYVDSDLDQVYRGYRAELLLSNLTEAVNDTRGIVVNYDGKIAITPYFSQSDGRTRTWSEVWGGTVAWCKSVAVPQDQGRQLLGHGVGMSARGALLMIMDDNKTYDQVLKYFYTGVTLDKSY